MCRARVVGGARRSCRTSGCAGPRHCGSEPVKSTISSSPRITTVTLIFQGRSGTTPSSSIRPSAVVLAVGPGGDLGAHQPLGDVLDVLEGLHERSRRRSGGRARRCAARRGTASRSSPSCRRRSASACGRSRSGSGRSPRPPGRLVDLERREADALLPGVPCVAERGRHHAADVGHVSDVDRVGEDLARRGSTA